MFSRRVYGLSKRFAALLALVTITLAGCGKKTRARVPSAPAPARVGATETGIASWYGHPYHGRRAASGEIYDMEQLTAAHRTLPFNTWVEVTDLDNSKRVDVRINDRGPFVDGRIIDLSLAAARSIDMLGPGTARVRLKVISAPRSEPPRADPSPTNSAPANSAPPAVELYAVQAGAFSDPERAGAFAASLRDEHQYKDAGVIESSIAGRTVWRVLIARDLPIDDANRLAAQVKEALGEALVVRNP